PLHEGGHRLVDDGREVLALAHALALRLHRCALGAQQLFMVPSQRAGLPASRLRYLAAMAAAITRSMRPLVRDADSGFFFQIGSSTCNTWASSIIATGT